MGPIRCMIVISLAYTVLGTKYSKVPTAFKAYNLTPDVIPTAPENFLNVYYPTAEVCLGDVISQTQTLVKPKIGFNFKPGVNYTIIIIARLTRHDPLVLPDPDVPSAQAPVLRSYLNWMQVDACASTPGLLAGTTIADYMTINPYPGSGYHRGTVLCYEQTRPLDLGAIARKRLAVRRYRFDVVAFATTYGLTLVGGNFFRVAVPAVYDEYYCNNCPTCLTDVYVK
ncbi:jg5473 [Pararge aegeria aegeria]|uniref:Jg5473 protein n=1 Tax=Pararge aegeria aegeria TaxID=348720 RepID=A0A8S4SLS6_9NEOP|nr:jg5473 [Pararge aegeria aegeria]